jgi:hypothetical protein
MSEHKFSTTFSRERHGPITALSHEATHALHGFITQALGPIPLTVKHVCVYSFREGFPADCVPLGLLVQFTEEVPPWMFAVDRKD